MELNNLKPAAGSNKNPKKRIGRGQGSGKGGTATRGHKGAQSRSGYSRKFGFEGGQMPIQRRTPKRGFKNINRKEYYTLNLDRVQAIIDRNSLSSFDIVELKEKKIIPNNARVKVLGNGEITSALEIKANAFSASAKEAIEKVGGSVIILD